MTLTIQNAYFLILNMNCSIFYGYFPGYQDNAYVVLGIHHEKYTEEMDNVMLLSNQGKKKMLLSNQVLLFQILCGQY